jgi:hypothetical protein
MRHANIAALLSHPIIPMTMSAKERTPSPSSMDTRLNSKFVNGSSNLRAMILPAPEAVIAMYPKSKKRKKKLPHKFVTGATNK